MSKRPPADKDRKLPQRWAFILFVAAVAGFLAAAATGPAGAITAAGVVIAVLHAVLD